MTQHVPKTVKGTSIAQHGRVILEFPATQSYKLQTVTPQGMKLLLVGIGNSELIQAMAQASWTTQMEQTTLGTEWKLVLQPKGSLEKYGKQLHQEQP